MKLKIKKGDIVQVITGNDSKHKDVSKRRGRVLEINTSNLTVLVEGMNIVTKHEKPNQRNQNGGLVKTEAPIHYSNVKLVENN